MTAQDVLRKAAAEIGYYAPADPEPGSKYGRWLADKWDQQWLAGPSSRIWWCVIFVSWVTDGLAAVPGLPGYNTDLLLATARPTGAVLVNLRDALPGDLTIFDWNKSTAATDHIGIVELNAGSHLQTIEGNTSGSDGVNQSNGNGVWRRTRGFDVVAAIIRPTFLDVAPAPVPVSNPIPAPVPAPVPTPIGLVVDGVFGPATKAALQRALGVTADGIVGPITTRALQRRVGATADGIWGPLTTRALQRYLRVTVDGIAGPQTYSALQLSLNVGQF